MAGHCPTARHPALCTSKREEGIYLEILDEVLNAPEAEDLFTTTRLACAPEVAYRPRIAATQAGGTTCS